MFWATKKIPSQISARGGQPHYLNAGEKALFARLPVGLQPEDYQLAQKVYAGILSAQEPDFVPKYLAGEEEWRIELNDLVVFARTWRQTPVGRAIHQMFEIPGYGNYCELAYQLFLLRMEAVDLAEKDKLLAEELAAMRKEYDEKEAEYLRICDYVEKIENNGKLFKIAQRFIEIKNVLEELFLAEKKVKEEIIPQYQQNPTNEELEKQIPETTYMLDLPGVQYPMIKLTALEILAPQFIEFLWDTNQEKFKWSLYENCGKEQFFHHLVTETLSEEHFCYLLNKGKELPSDRTALAEVIRIYEKIHTKCWGRFVTLFFDEEGEKKLLSFIHRDFPHLIPERESYRRNFFVPYDENWPLRKQEFDWEHERSMEHIKYTEGVDKDPLQLWEIFFLYEKIFAEKTLETNPLLQEESEYKLVKEISFPGEEVVYSSILNNNYSFFWGGDKPLSRRDEQFNFAYDTKSHRFYEQIRASSIKDKSVKKSNKLMSFIQAFWKVFHKKELLKIVNNFKLLGRKKLQKVTKLEIKKNNLFTNKKVLKPSFELRKTEKYLNVVKEIMKEETNLTIKDEILKIAENCITRRRIRTFARFNFFAATGKKSHELKFEDLEDIFKMFWTSSYNEKSGLTVNFVFADVESELHDHCYGLRNYEKQKSKDLLNFASEIRKKEEVQRNHQQLTQQVTGKITNLVEKVPRAQIVLAVTNIPESQLTSEPTSHTPAIGLLVGFLTVIYFGWDKFWAWYESPLTEEWDWDEEEEEED